MHADPQNLFLVDNGGTWSHYSRRDLTHYVAKADFELLVLLCLSLRWGHRYVPLFQLSVVIVVEPRASCQASTPPMELNSQRHILVLAGPPGGSDIHQLPIHLGLQSGINSPFTTIVSPTPT